MLAEPGFKLMERAGEPLEVLLRGLSKNTGTSDRAGLVLHLGGAFFCPEDLAQTFFCKSDRCCS